MWGPTLSPVTFPFVRTARKASAASSVSVRPLLGKDAGRVGSYDSTGQQCSRHPPCFLRRIPIGVLQRMREDGDETGIARRLARQIGRPLRADKKDRLRG